MAQQSQQETAELGGFGACHLPQGRSLPPPSVARGLQEWASPPELAMHRTSPSPPPHVPFEAIMARLDELQRGQRTIELCVEALARRGEAVEALADVPAALRRTEQVRGPSWCSASFSSAAAQECSLADRCIMIDIYRHVSFTGKGWTKYGYAPAPLLPCWMPQALANSHLGFPSQALRELSMRVPLNSSRAYQPPASDRQGSAARGASKAVLSL